MAKKLFVGGLSFNTDDTGLKEAFAAYGEVVEAKVVTDRESGRSRGFGFVTMGDEEAATKAIAGLNGQQLDGRPLNVSEARDRSSDRKDLGGSNRDGGYNRGGGGRNRW